MVNRSLATALIMLLGIINLFSQSPSSNSLLDAALQIQQNEIAFMSLDTELNTSRRVTYKSTANVLSQTSTINNANANSGPTPIVGGSFFGEGFGEAAVYSDGKGISVD